MPKADEMIEELERLLEAAQFGRLIADTHHRQDYAGRSHGFIRSEGELVPVGAVVLAVEGMPDEQGVARLQAIVAAVNALPGLLAELKVARQALEPFARCADRVRADDPDNDRPALATVADYRRARTALTAGGSDHG